VELTAAAAARLPALARRHLGPGAATLLASVAPSHRLRHTGACAPGSAGSRLGGTALLAPGEGWPAAPGGRPLSLLAQLAPGTLPTAAAAGLTLGFFYDADRQEAWGSRPDDAPYWRVTGVPAGAAHPASPPPGTTAFTPVKLAAEPAVTLPDQEEQVLEALYDADDAALDRLYDELGPTPTGPRHRLLGWPDILQSPMQSQCLLPGDGDGDGHAAAGAGWRLLLQVDSDDAAGWMWGDVGTVYFWIPAADLAAGRFDRVWLIFQTC
jgi:hypothetical protein